jgi:hypothetical protein
MAGAGARLDLDEHHGRTAPAHDVDFAEPRPVPPGKNGVPSPPQFAARQVLAQFSKGLSIDTLRHSIKKSNPCARNLRASYCV